MKRAPLLIAGIISILVLPGCGVEKEKLYGTWVLESGPGVMPAGMAMEFTSDGKVKIGGKIMGQDVPMTESGTYSVSGSILTLNTPGKKGGQARITTLTDDKLVLKDDAQPTDAVFKKKK